MGNVTRIKPVMTSGRSGGSGNGPAKWIFAALGGIAVAAAAVALADMGVGPVLVIAAVVLGVAGVAAQFAPQQSLKIAGVASLVVALVGSAGLLAGVLKYEVADLASSPTLDTLAPATTTPVAAVTSGPVRSGEGWYDLALHEPVDSGEGQELIASIAIGVGKDPFPNSIRGSQISTAAQPRNFST